MSLKNIVLSAVFAVVAFVLYIVSSMLTSAFGVIGTYLHSSIGTFLCATVFVVMCRKTGMRGSALIFFGLQGLAYLFMGMPPMAAILLGAAVAAELCLIPGYDKNAAIAAAYVVGSLIVSLHGVILLAAFGVEGLAQQFSDMFSLEAAQAAYDFFFDIPTLGIVLAIQLAFSVAGLFLAFFIDRKYFSKTKQESALGA